MRIHMSYKAYESMQPLQMLLYLFLYIYIALKLSRQSLTPLSKHTILLKILNQWQILEDIFKLTLKDNEIKVHNNNLAEKKKRHHKTVPEAGKVAHRSVWKPRLVFCTNWKFDKLCSWTLIPFFFRKLLRLSVHVCLSEELVCPIL